MNLDRRYLESHFESLYPLAGVFLLLGLFFPGWFQVDAQAQDAMALVERLHRGEAATTLDGKDDKPWHLEMTFELFGEKGEPKDSGSVEEWWAPEGYRIAVASGQYNAVEVRNGKGRYRTAGAFDVPFAIDQLRLAIVHPVPSDLDTTDTTPELRAADFGAVAADCVMLRRKIGEGLKTGSVSKEKIPLGLFPTVCFDRDKDSVRLVEDSILQPIVLTSLGRFGGKTVALTLAVLNGKQTASRAQVVTLSGTKETVGSFDDVTGLDRLESEPAIPSKCGAKGKPVARPDPIYPASAKSGHVSGVVIFRAIIGEDGHVRKLQAKQVPDPNLAIAAMDAVRRWTYEPCRVDGKPSAVDTTITVSFLLSR